VPKMRTGQTIQKQEDSKDAQPSEAHSRCGHGCVPRQVIVCTYVLQINLTLSLPGGKLTYFRNPDTALFTCACGQTESKPAKFERHVEACKSKDDDPAGGKVASGISEKRRSSRYEPFQSKSSGTTSLTRPMDVDEESAEYGASSPSVR
jgi:hypothetical protein